MAYNIGKLIKKPHPSGWGRGAYLKSIEEIKFIVNLFFLKKGKYAEALLSNKGTGAGSVK